MSIKLSLLKTGEQIIADIKELVKEDLENERQVVYGYVFTKPHKIRTESPVILTERILTEDQNLESSDRSVDIVFSPWIILTEEEEILVSVDWVVTIVQPLKSVVELFEEKVNGKIN